MLGANEKSTSGAHSASVSPYHETRANEFDARVGDVAVERALQVAHGRSALDIGCGYGLFTTRLFEHFDRVVGLDRSEENIAQAREQLADPRHAYVVGDAENFQLSEKFDSIFMMHILEHVDRPVETLRNAATHLAPRGRIIVQVPNARSFNRQLAKIMGLIGDIHELNQEEIDRFGHQRVYDVDLLGDDIARAGLELVSCEGIVFKPLTNSQMQLICDSHNDEWRDKFVRALAKLGERFPAECTAISVVVAAPNSR